MIYRTIVSSPAFVSLNIYDLCCRQAGPAHSWVEQHVCIPLGSVSLLELYDKVKIILPLNNYIPVILKVH